MKNKLLTIALFAGIAHAECVLQSNTATQATVKIQERSGLTQEIVRMPSGSQRCQVAFRARVGNEWHTAMSYHDTEPEGDIGRACSIAQQRAETGLVNRLSPKRVATDSVLTCRDQPDFNVLRETRVGTVGLIHQFRPHPNYPNRFVHNGTQCQMFIDPVLNAGDVKIWQGVICNLQDQKWVVVDKF